MLSTCNASHHPFPRHSVCLIVFDLQHCRLILTTNLFCCSCTTNRRITSKVHCDATAYQECDIACSRNLFKTFLAGSCTVKSIRSLIPSPCGMHPNGIPPRTEPVRGILRPAGPLCPQHHLREYRRAAPYRTFTGACMSHSLHPGRSVPARACEPTFSGAAKPVPCVASPLRRRTNAWHKVGTSLDETDHLQVRIDAPLARTVPICSRFPSDSAITGAARDSAQARWATVRVAWPTSTSALRWGGNADARPSPSVTSSTRTHEIAAGNAAHARSMLFSVGTRHRELILQLSRHAPVPARGKQRGMWREPRIRWNLQLRPNPSAEGRLASVP